MDNDSAASFECNVCFELAQEPIVTLCGHLFCWPCLYKWLHLHSRSQDCPVCKAVISEEKLVPLYGRGKTSTSHDPQSRSIPDRPTGQRPGIAPPPDPNHFAHQNPPRSGSYVFSLFPYLNFHVYGFPDAYGSFHGGHGHAFHHHYHHHHHPSHGHQHADVYLKAMLFLVAALVAATLVLS